MITEKCRVFLVPEVCLTFTSLQHLVEPLDIPRCFESLNKAVILPFDIHCILRIGRMSTWPESCAVKVKNFMEHSLQAATVCDPKILSEFNFHGGTSSPGSLQVPLLYLYQAAEVQFVFTRSKNSCLAAERKDQSPSLL